RKLHSEGEAEQHKIQQLNARIEQLDKYIEELDKQIEQHETALERIRNLNDKIKKEEAERDALKKNVIELHNELENEFTETDEEVEKFKREFLSQLNNLQEEKFALEEKLRRKQ